MARFIVKYLSLFVVFLLVPVVAAGSVSAQPTNYFNEINDAQIDESPVTEPERVQVPSTVRSRSFNYSSPLMGRSSGLYNSYPSRGSLNLRYRNTSFIPKTANSLTRTSFYPSSRYSINSRFGNNFIGPVSTVGSGQSLEQQVLSLNPFHISIGGVDWLVESFSDLVGLGQLVWSGLKCLVLRDCAAIKEVYDGFVELAGTIVEIVKTDLTALLDVVKEFLPENCKGDNFNLGRCVGYSILAIVFSLITGGAALKAFNKLFNLIEKLDLGSMNLTKLVDKVDVFKAQRHVGDFCSFSGETNVLMADGSFKPISHIVVGDFVAAYDPETKSKGTRRVEHVWVHQDELVDLKVDGSVVRTTLDHPFWNVTDQQWQPVSLLDESDRILTADDETIRVQGVTESSSTIGRAFNLAVDDIHTYYVQVGTQTALVHNRCFKINPAKKVLYHFPPTHKMQDFFNKMVKAKKAKAREMVDQLVKGTFNESKVKKLVNGKGYRGLSVFEFKGAPSGVRVLFTVSDNQLIILGAGIRKDLHDMVKMLGLVDAS